MYQYGDPGELDGVPYDNDSEDGYGNKKSWNQQDEAEEGGKQESDSESDEDTTFCKACNHTFTSDSSYYLHLRGMSHTQNVERCEKHTKEGGNSQAAKSWSYTGKSSTATQNRPPVVNLFCAVCYVAYDTKEAYDLHLKTQQHLKKTNQDEPEFIEAPLNPALISGMLEDCYKFEKNTIIYCKACEVACNGPATYEAHIQGGKHQKIMRRLMSQTDDPDSTMAEEGTLEAIMQRKHSSVEEFNQCTEPQMGVGGLIEFQHGLKDEPKFHCDLCDSNLLRSSLATHIVGFKHRRRYVKFNQPEFHADIVRNMNKEGGNHAKMLCEQFAQHLQVKLGQQLPRLFVEIKGNVIQEAKDKGHNVQERNGKIWVVVYEPPVKVLTHRDTPTTATAIAKGPVLYNKAAPPIQVEPGTTGQPKSYTTMKFVQNPNDHELKSVEGEAKRSNPEVGSRKRAHPDESPSGGDKIDGKPDSKKPLKRSLSPLSRRGTGNQNPSEKSPPEGKDTRRRHGLGFDRSKKKKVPTATLR